MDPDRQHCRNRKRRAALLIVASLLCAPTAFASDPPNILFIIMDDVGIDQMETFGYGGTTPPSTPAIQELADEGIRFTNAWAMPACSTTRALLFTGRYPARTHVQNPLGQNDLANSMVSQFDATTPKLLRERGYESALFGKFHIALQSNNQAMYQLPHALGWDYFAGWLDETGDPFSIDTTAGGVAPEDTWSCGFVGGLQDNPRYGASFGACYAGDGSCVEMASTGSVPPGRTCRDQGGIFDPRKSCEPNPPSNLEFGTLSGHYVSPLVYNYPDGTAEIVDLRDPRARRYRGQVVVEEAIEWINERPKHTPWMATVSFASAHTPVMQPPDEELRSVSGDESGIQCAGGTTQDVRKLTDLMIEAMDTEIERLLLETGLAKKKEDGALDYNPHDSDTMIILIGDNGTLGNTVKAPFDLRRAKGTAYQTGVWVPLIVSGPIVKQPHRAVPYMVNAVDLYQLFGEIAGIDVPATVPRPIDSESMLPYLEDADQESIRAYNFTQVGPNLQAGGGQNGPCVIGNTCVQLPPTADVCTDNGGVWYGDVATDCCGVNMLIAMEDPPGKSVNVQASSSVGVRDDDLKIVQNTVVDWDNDQGLCVTTVSHEHYRISEDPLRLDRELSEIPSEDWAPHEIPRFKALQEQLDDILLPNYDCKGDGNLDFVVDDEDKQNVESIAADWGGSSHYDFNLDGKTDEKDIATVEAHLGTICPIVVDGVNDKDADPQAVRAAVNLGVERGGEKGRVVLRGQFDFSDCRSCIVVNGPVMIEGVGDPSGAAQPDPRSVTVINSNTLAPFVIQDESSGEGTIRIERLWFASAMPIALQVAKLNGTLEVVQNRFTGIIGELTLRFAVGGTALGSNAGNLKGHFRAFENHIDTRGVPFDIGDDNGFAFAQCDFESIEIRQNRIYTRGEGVEVEGCTNPAAVIEIVGNEFITDATVSNLAPLTTPSRLPGVGGHPAVLKVIASEAASVHIADNDVTLRGWPTAICIMPGLSNKKGTMLIENNHCDMDGQFAALLAGWAGFPLFFPPFYLQNSVVRGNLFEGTAQNGVVFSDFSFDPNSNFDEVNLGNGNLFEDNDMTGLQIDGVGLFFDERTKKNQFIGDPNGPVVDLGKKNEVVAD